MVRRQLISRLPFIDVATIGASIPTICIGEIEPIMMPMRSDIKDSWRSNEMPKNKPDALDQALDILMEDLEFRRWVLEQALCGRITELSDPANEKIIERLRVMPEYVEIILHGRPIDEST
jgi:hypothetical protein